MKALNTLKRFWREDQGLETVEYAIITGLIVAATITAIGVLGGWVTTQFESVNENVGASASPE